MGTEFTIYQTDRTELSLSEMDCTFDLDAVIRAENGDWLGHFNVGQHLTPEQVAEIAKQLVIAASHFVEDPETFINAHIYSLSANILIQFRKEDLTNQN